MALISLTEGKNREVRKVMKAIGLDVARLIRLSYGPFQLGSMKKGEVREIHGKVMREQLEKIFKYENNRRQISWQKAVVSTL